MPHRPEPHVTRTTTLLSIVTLLAFLATACDIVDARDDDVVGRRVFIGNQGEFSAGNGTISRYDPETNAASTAVRDLESIVQSIEIHDGRLYVAANTGGRVDVFDAATAARIGTVEGLASPRYMAFSGDRLFVTNLYDDADTFSGGTVTVINLNTLTIEGEITVGDNPEGIAVAGDRLLVANAAFGFGSTVTIISLPELEVLTTLEVECDGPRYLLADDDDDVFVFCTGQTIYNDDFVEVGSTDGAIRVVDATSGSIIQRTPVEGRMMSAEFGQDAYFDVESRRIFALRNDPDGRYTVLVISTVTNAVVDTIGPFDGRIGGIGYDGAEDVLYLTRVPGFTQAGTVTVYDMDGEALRSFTAGVAPTSIRFRAGQTS